MAEKTVKVRRTKAYVIQVSKGEPIKIDEDELPKVIAAMQSGAPCILKQGIVNPSYITSVAPDKDRIQAWLEECKYGFGQGDAARERGMKPLEALINRDEVLKQLGAAGVKMLGSGN